MNIMDNTITIYGVELSDNKYAFFQEAEEAVACAEEKGRKLIDEYEVPMPMDDPELVVEMLNYFQNVRGMEKERYYWYSGTKRRFVHEYYPRFVVEAEMDDEPVYVIDTTQRENEDDGVVMTINPNGLTTPAYRIHLAEKIASMLNKQHEEGTLA